MAAGFELLGEPLGRRCGAGGQLCAIGLGVGDAPVPPLPVPALGGKGKSSCLGILPPNWGEAAP